MIEVEIYLYEIESYEGTISELTLITKERVTVNLKTTAFVLQKTGKLADKEGVLPPVSFR